MSRVFTFLFTRSDSFPFSSSLESDLTLIETVPVDMRSETVPVELSKRGSVTQSEDRIG